MTCTCRPHGVEFPDNLDNREYREAISIGDLCSSLANLAPSLPILPPDPPILRSVLDPKLLHRHYFGYSQDLKARVNDHNKGKNPSTKPWRPWRLAFYAAFEMPLNEPFH